MKARDEICICGLIYFLYDAVFIIGTLDVIIPARDSTGNMTTSIENCR